MYRDEYTGEVLPPELIRAAIKEELAYFNAHVWEVTLAADGFSAIRGTPRAQMSAQG